MTQALGGISARMRGRLRWTAAALGWSWRSRRPPGVSVTTAIASSAGRFGRRAFAERRYEAGPRTPEELARSAPSLGGGPLLPGLAGPGGQPPGRGRDEAARRQELGFDRYALEVLQAIYQSRGGRINDAEPMLRRAYDRIGGARAEVARELARIYLTTYRLTQAAEVVERYRALMPADPQPYLWSTEIGARTDAMPAEVIRNYRAALERDPDLDKARLGLAEQLTKDRRFDEAEVEYRAYLRRNPRDAAAMVGLGRNALQGGDIEGAARDLRVGAGGRPPPGRRHQGAGASSTSAPVGSTRRADGSSG